MIALLCFFLTLLVSPFKSKSRLEAENAALRAHPILGGLHHRYAPQSRMVGRKLLLWLKIRVLRFRLMMNARSALSGPQASEGEAQHGLTRVRKHAHGIAAHCAETCADISGVK
jgi:hypothetical protein